MRLCHMGQEITPTWQRLTPPDGVLNPIYPDVDELSITDLASRPVPT